MFATDLKDIDDKTFAKFIQVIHRFTGITISPNRKTMLQVRLRPRMRSLSIGTFSEYLEYVETRSEEKQEFIDLVTTNETYFYRTPRIWSHIETNFLEAWYAQNPGITFQAWSAAASTGEEAHTLAIFLQQFKEKNPKFNYQILATDISKDVLAVGETGIYGGRSIELFHNSRGTLAHKYMKEVDAGKYVVIPEVHDKIKFQTFNLFEKSNNTGRFDLVLIRNVLIYFTSADQEKVLSNVHRTMKENATLVIGESESLNHLKTSFEYKAPLIYTSMPFGKVRKAV